MRRNDLQPSAGFCDPVQLRHKTKHVGNMLDHVAANDLFKLIVVKRIWKGSEIVNDVCMTQRVCIDANCAGKLVLTAADIEHTFHALVFVQEESR